MSGVFFINKRGAPLLLLTVFGAALLAGCGGGGSNGNGNNGGYGNNSSNNGIGNNNGVGNNNGTNNGGTTANASVIGKVVDTQGNGVPGVNINTDTGGVLATTMAQGGYRLDNITGNVVHVITAAVTRQDNVTFSGSTQVYTIGNALVSNANIILSRTDQQATVSGTVYSSDGSTPVSGARVFLSVPNQANFSSLVAYTGSNGQYTIANIPTNLPAGNITIAASTTGAQNQSFTLTGLQAGGFGHQDFRLNGSTGQSLNTPNIIAVTAFTEPTDAVSGSIRQARAAQGSAQTSVYEHLSRLLTPAYARLAAGHRGLGKRLKAHASSLYAVQTDVAFDDPNQTGTGSVLNYNLYQTTGTQTLPSKQQAPYDQLFDPLANFYTYLTFSGNSNSYLAYAQYNFALSAVNTDSTETGLSQVFTVTPLGPLTLNQPTRGQTLPNNITLTWNPVSGATKYYVYIYDQYPTAEITPIYTSHTSGTQVIPAGATSYTVNGGLQSGSSYYAVVAGAADPTENTNAQTGQPTTITNGTVTFSQITRFFVQ